MRFGLLRDSVLLAPAGRVMTMNLSAVPEPYTLILAAVALLGGGWRRRKRA